MYIIILLEGIKRNFVSKIKKLRLQKILRFSLSLDSGKKNILNILPIFFVHSRTLGRERGKEKSEGENNLEPIPPSPLPTIEGNLKNSRYEEDNTITGIVLIRPRVNETILRIRHGRRERRKRRETKETLVGINPYTVEGQRKLGRPRRALINEILKMLWQFQSRPRLTSATRVILLDSGVAS